MLFWIVLYNNFFGILLVYVEDIVVVINVLLGMVIDVFLVMFLVLVFFRI